MCHGLGGLVLNRGPALAHGLARGRISPMKCPGVAEQEPRLDHATGVLERSHDIVATLRVEHVTGYSWYVVVRFEQGPGPLFANVAEPTLDEPSGMGMQN